METTSRNWSISSRKQALDRFLLFLVFALLGAGVLQTFSSSYIFATENFGDGFHFVKRQLLFSILFIAVMLSISVMPSRWIFKWFPALWHISVIGIILTFIPGLGHSAGGAQRWIQLPFSFRFEPSEFLKVGTVLLFCRMMCLKTELNQIKSWLWPTLIAAAPLVLLLRQPDFGTFVLLIVTLLALLFYFGWPWRYLFFGFLLSIPAFYFLVMTVPYRRARVRAFLDPWSDPGKAGFQIIQSLLSFYSGSFTGVGLGQSQGKLFFLPEAHTDFTLAILGEEMGFLGVLALMITVGWIVVRGFQISIASEDRYRRSVALGLIFLFALQFMTNVAVVLGLVPTKGLSLPFLSYGGSSLLAHAVLFGVLLNIGRKEQTPTTYVQEYSRHGQ